MKKTELLAFVGKNITLIFKDGKEERGVLGYTKEFSSKYNYRKPDCFTINNWDFKVSHIKRVVKADEY